MGLATTRCTDGATVSKMHGEEEDWQTGSSGKITKHELTGVLFAFMGFPTLLKGLGFGFRTVPLKIKGSSLRLWERIFKTIFGSFQAFKLNIKKPKPWKTSNKKSGSYSRLKKKPPLEERFCSHRQNEIVCHVLHSCTYGATRPMAAKASAQDKLLLPIEAKLWPHTFGGGCLSAPSDSVTVTSMSWSHAGMQLCYSMKSRSDECELASVPYAAS
eukprot:6484829-Amphidinium_carterae.1